MNQLSGVTGSNKLLDFGTRVSRYFLDFLETDFKRQKAPRRRIVVKNAAGQLMSFSLRKYDRLNRDILDLIREPATEKGASIKITRGKYVSRISATLRNLITQQIEAIPDREFAQIAARTVDDAKASLSKSVEDPERWIEGIIASVEDAVAANIVLPLLTQLEVHLKAASWDAEESIFEIQNEIVEALTRDLGEHLPSALNSLIVSGKADKIEAVFTNFFDTTQAKRHMSDYFDTFAASDAYNEIRELHSNAKLAGDNFQLYLYVADLHFKTASFPLFYIAAGIQQGEDGASFVLELDTRVFVNKAAVDWVSQEAQISGLRLAMNPVEDRIIYLKPDVSQATEIDRVIRRIQSIFDLDQQVTIATDGPRQGRSLDIRITANLHFAVFDKSDEALLNDYETLLTELKGQGGAVAELFTNVVTGFIDKDPARFDSAVDEHWENVSVPDRLVAETPIPLNEEQRKVLEALGRSDVRYLVIQGPPGTGKSHTITAIAFDHILNGKTVLILSDKGEALDVVEDKLTKAINGVRVHDSFQNPILRLGRQGGTYTKLLTQSSIGKIKTYHNAAKGQRSQLKADIKAAREKMRANIAASVEHLSAVSIQQIHRLHELEAAIEKWLPNSGKVIGESSARPAKVTLESIQSVRDWLVSPSGAEAIGEIISFSPTSPKDVVGTMKKLALASQMSALHQERHAFSVFKSLDPQSHHSVIESFIVRYDSLKLPILGYLFRGAALRETHAAFNQAVPLSSILEVHKRLGDIRTVARLLPAITEVIEAWALPQEDFDWIFAQSVHKGRSAFPNCTDLTGFIASTLAAFPELRSVTWADESGIERFISLCLDAAEMSLLWAMIGHHERQVPQFDFVAERSRLEQLYATQMTHEMDSRFLSFAENSAATAKTLATVIRTRQKFPTEAFAKLRDAFPCIIAGIREFAEYIPLERDMFDLVIIDEASQVSVAQAFPALLRAKKVLVMGDNRQFSNIKSAQASTEINASYTAELQSFFRQNVSDAADKMVRASMFDVKRSILDFFDLIANYTTMLKKHFRGYQELISFSSQTFYGGALQAIKVRGCPVEDVIQFTVLDHDGRKERYRNTNSMEAEFIREELDAILEESDEDDAEYPTVGVITPFREQVTLLAKELFNSPNGKLYEEKLKLKVMTFDTCQGEEREIIFYSMVATATQDSLNYIFPVDLTNAFDRVEEALKVQRLNVGFSRAQECIHFVLSKPIDQYVGSARAVLQHYERILNDRSMPEQHEVDPASPMEGKVLQWLNAATFVQNHRDEIEVQAQFPIGDYLRQLDPFYKHPSYRADFLLTYSNGDGKPINIIIEYDGFQEHFTDRKNVHVGNWAEYYKPDDIERQMIIESYGYKFLRINRFNLGTDPAQTLSRRLAELIKAAEDDDDHERVKAIRSDVEDLQNGDKKMCQRCNQIRDLKDFWDQSLKKGAGGHGRVCAHCKLADKTSRAGHGGVRRRRRRRW
ncbi:protein of unknown function [Magnetospirillum sp. XM-1]|uniref:AAA domain-containing protein n=1 Tax=Magnetospirillum sp. XM-1 TaxID=1663591 RepID=UPI00073DFDD3|nr:AAA domain-containing protein [Magnetospirillum sp. XM-1]CUW40073.1 protein of unknown function [Magnetospirillum sp. XM-1]